MNTKKRGYHQIFPDDPDLSEENKKMKIEIFTTVSTDTEQTEATQNTFSSSNAIKKEKDGNTIVDQPDASQQIFLNVKQEESDKQNEGKNTGCKKAKEKRQNKHKANLVNGKYNGQKFKWLDTLSYHQCPKCDYGINDSYKMKRHMLCHSLDNKGKFKCKICGASYLNLGAKTRHEKQMHNGKKGAEDFEKMVHKCEEKGCFYKTSFKWNLQQHIKWNHTVQTEGNKSEMVIKQEVLENDGENRETEQSPDQEIPENLSKSNPIFTNPKPDPKTIKITIQEDNFKEKLSSTTKYYSCEKCDFKTSYKWNYDYHMKVHNGVTVNRGGEEEERKFKCRICGYGYRREVWRDKHEMKMHGAEVTEVTEVDVK